MKKRLENIESEENCWPVTRLLGKRLSNQRGHSYGDRSLNSGGFGSDLKWRRFLQGKKPESTVWAPPIASSPGNGEVTTFFFWTRGSYQTWQKAENWSISGLTEEFGSFSSGMQHRFPGLDWVFVSFLENTKGLIAPHSQKFLKDKRHARNCAAPRLQSLMGETSWHRWEYETIVQAAWPLNNCKHCNALYSSILTAAICQNGAPRFARPWRKERHRCCTVI